MINFNILNDNELNEIIESGYRILENIGVDVFCEKSIKIMEKAGCIIDGSRVKIPRKVVESALETVPSIFNVYDRNGNVAMELGERNSYYGSGPTCPNYMDPYTGVRRTATKEDAKTSAIVADYLKNIDYVMSLCLVVDKERGTEDVNEVDALIRNTSKPVASWAYDAENLKGIIDLCAAAKGSLEEFQKEPFLIIYSEPTTPLQHTKDALEKVIVLAENSVPCIYTPGMIMGAAAPVTIAGAMSMGIAECLTGLVVHQNVNPGAPFIGGCAGSPMDMKTTNPPYGSPENILIHGASSEIWRKLGVPSFGLAGATDSKTVDAQAGFEAAFSVFISAACGGNLIHDVGFTDFGMTGSPMQLVLGNEIISHSNRLRRGIDVSENHLAYEVIEEVGPGGNFLQNPHTFQNFRKEQWFPEISERRGYGEWEADGKKTMDQVAMERVQYILENHQPEKLSDEILAKLDKVLEREEERINSNNVTAAI
jgi:trimethylamine--corrinoid protein Co-methyltransferase